MSTMSFGKLGEHLESGLLADRVLSIITKDQSLNKIDRLVIERSLSFIDNIIQGRKQVNSGQIQNNAVISVNAYTNTMLAIHYTNNKSSKNIEDFFTLIKDELNETLQNGRVLSSNLNNSITFFKIIKSYNSFRVSNILYNKNEDVEWLIQAK